MKYLIIGRDECGNPKMKAEINGITYPDRLYMFYTEKEAIKEYRNEFNLVGKHLTRIDTGASSCYYI